MTLWELARELRQLTRYASMIREERLRMTEIIIEIEHRGLREDETSRQKSNSASGSSHAEGHGYTGGSSRILP